MRITPPPSLPLSGGTVHGTTVLSKDPSAKSALDVRSDSGTSDNLMRFYDNAVGQYRTYFNGIGAFHTQEWIVVSGTTTGTGDAYTVVYPSSDQFMLGAWSDVGGPTLQVRGSIAAGSRLFSGLDAYGNYTFAVDNDGKVSWGAGTRGVGMAGTSAPGQEQPYDTNLYRSAADTLKTDDSLVVGGDFFTAHRRTRSLTRTLPTTVNTAVDVGSFAVTNGSALFRITVVVASTGYSVAKTFTVPVFFSQTSGGWVQVNAAGSTGAYGGNDFALDCKVSIDSTAAFRLRCTATDGSSVGTAQVTIETDGTTSDAFTPSTATAAVSAPTTVHPGSPFAAAGGKVGVWTLSPTANFQVSGCSSFMPLPPPSGLAVAPTGVTGSTTWGYKVVATNSVGDSLASAEVTATTGNATLSGSNYNALTWERVAGASGYKVYRTTAGGTPATTGLLGAVGATPAYNDTGAAASGSAGADSSYRVGVGTTAPAGLLHVSGASVTGTDLPVAVFSNTAGGVNNDYTVTLNAANKTMKWAGASGTSAFVFANSFVVGTAALATSATAGFLYLPSCAGTPSGTPATQTGTVPCVVDTAASKLWAYIGGAWKSVTFA